ncbi:MAG: hypothetical protein LAT64_12945 [Phycisphaerales bacterium]|nr:hypothetical protein [Planctomycetota bacterium]MCH8509662.1 hypothetical protein [Phycisphaerales bacterium]
MDQRRAQVIGHHKQWGCQWGWRGGLALAALLAAGAAGATGCQKTALRPDDVRSPYDRYERVRAERAEPYLEDEFGRRTPNLRGRLLQRSE